MPADSNSWSSRRRKMPRLYCVPVVVVKDSTAGPHAAKPEPPPAAPAFLYAHWKRLADFLGHPATCPHGHPIMEDGGGEPELRLTPLVELPAGAEATVRRITHEDADLLTLLSSLGITLGTAVRVEGSEPYGGPLRIDVGGQPRQIGREAAAMVLVER